MMFFGQDLLKAHYFRPQYLHGAEEETTGRSGYWRLFFHQLQEDALRKDEEKLKEAIKEAVAPVLADAPTKPKKVVKLEPLVELEEFPEVKFNRKPIFTRPPSIKQVSAAWLSSIAQKTKDDVERLQDLVAKHVTAKVEAANDADYRIRLLLLTA